MRETSWRFCGSSIRVMFLVIMYVFTKKSEVYIMLNCIVRETIKKLFTLFNCFEVPETLMTDNGSHLTFDAFRQLYDINGITH